MRSRSPRRMKSGRVSHDCGAREAHFLSSWERSTRCIAECRVKNCPW
jgi:hypothetical protein